MATQKSQTTTAKKDETKDAAKAAAASYGERANALAADTRELADNIREDLAKLRERCIDDFADTAPEPADAAAADGVRRIPMAIDEVTRALDGLVVTAADLTRAATA